MFSLSVENEQVDAGRDGRNWSREIRFPGASGDYEQDIGKHTR